MSGVIRRAAARARLWLAGVVVEFLWRGIAREQRAARDDRR